MFLESRERQHLHHNTLVSVFLRQLEYFQGVMILTTNRVTAFDEAVQSRIHLGIKYDPLSRKAKAEVWTNFLEQANVACGKGKATRVTPSQLEDLSRRDFNGRQVRFHRAYRFHTRFSNIVCRSRTQSAWLTPWPSQRAHRWATNT